MSVAISTAGMQVAFGLETTAGTKPTTFTNIPGPKSIPDMNPAPSTKQSTDLNATEYHTYIPGLKDPGGALAIKFNMSQEFFTMWKTDIVAAYNTAKTSGKAMWFQFLSPDLTEAFFFTGVPAPLGFSAAEVDSIYECTVYVTPTGNMDYGTKIETT